MEFRHNKTFLLTLSCLLLSCNATRILNFPPVGAPTPTESTAESQDQDAFMVDTVYSVATTAASTITTKTNPAITGFCAGTTNPALCAESLAPVAMMSGAFDPVKALEAEIKATGKQAMTVATAIAAKLSDPTTPKAAFDALDICKSQYEDMQDTIKEVLQLLAQQNVVDAYYKFSAVISDKSSCDDAFVESPGVENPLTKDSKAVAELGGNCLDTMFGIVNHIKL